MVSYSYRQTSLQHSLLRYYDNIITIRAFLTQFQWHEANLLDNWQLAELPQSGGCEFDPRMVHDNLSVPLWVYMRFPVPKHQNQTKQICISPAPGRSSKLKHTGVKIDTCAFQTGCQLSSAASGMSLELRFLHNFSGMKQTCWTTGTWRSCLSLEGVSSIPAGSTIICRFLCGFICVSLSQSIKIKPNKYILNQNEFTDHVYCISQHFPKLGALALEYMKSYGSHKYWMSDVMYCMYFTKEMPISFIW